jgi:hypothetical protein
MTLAIGLSDPLGRPELLIATVAITLVAPRAPS